MNIEALINSSQSYPYSKEILFTVLVFLGFILSRKIIGRRITKNKDLKKAEKLAIIKKLNFYSNFLLVFLILLLWFSQLHSVFVSLLAVAAAVVLATKEMIMCITGGILVSMNKYFKDGDRIEIHDIRGYVIEKSFTTTKILEIGPEKNSQQTTGNIIAIPNSLFLTQTLKNESYFQGYSINSFAFKHIKKMRLEELEKFLLEKANEIVAPYLANAVKYISRFCEKEGFDIPSIEPRVKVFLDDESEVHLLLKMPVKNNDVANIEQKLLRDYVKFSENFKNNK